jgi:NTE family protein
MTQKKTALVLAGGGLTGAVYEIGALRAIDDLLIDLSVNEFDIFVGTSAGAMVSSFLANGVTPEELFGGLDGTNKEVDTIDRQDIFHLNLNDYLRWGLHLPSKLLKTWSHYLQHIPDLTFFDLIWSFSEVLPSGLYDGLGMEKYVRKTLDELGYSNNFHDIARDLYIIATDLDTGKRAVFGPNYLDAPISLAVAASSALPLVYRPVRIGDYEYIDGGMRGAASIDLAIEQGAKLIVCINPLVPFDRGQQMQNKQAHIDENSDHLSNKGIQSIAGQTIRIFSHAGLHYHIKQLRRAHPHVDIILIEPKPDDYQMFFYNIMHYSARMIVAQHGFQSITIDLATEYQYYKDVLNRHGIRISRRLVIEELNEIIQSNYNPQVIRKVMEASMVGCKQHHPKTAVCQLSRVLSELDALLSAQAN